MKQQAYEAGIAVRAAKTAEEVHSAIANILTLRGKLLHLATSDQPVENVRVIRGEVVYLDDLLIQAFCKLPDHRPDFPLELTDGDGNVTLKLQGVRGDNATYVTPDKWDALAVRIAPLKRADRYKNERTQSEEVLAVIRAYESIVRVAPQDDTR